VQLEIAQIVNFVYIVNSTLSTILPNFFKELNYFTPRRYEFSLEQKVCKITKNDARNNWNTQIVPGIIFCLEILFSGEFFKIFE
jgi:hypothetical protein